MAVEYDVRLARESRFMIAGDGDYRRAEPLEIGDERDQLLRLAAVADKITHILAADHAEVAVSALRGVQEKGRHAERGEGRRRLASHMARFAEPGHDDAAAAAAHEVRGRRHFLPHSLGGGAQRACLFKQDIFSRGKQLPGGELLFFAFVRQIHLLFLRPVKRREIDLFADDLIYLVCLTQHLAYL
ncbi:hypothetical protein SDC9_198794 [bioreactor metagenome]|uniref:Uncharacterized protein n=1 Tax=bioreactor metagenome TaxID=1076179 RepID=A0A645IJW3_9ZZZZ